MKKMLRMMIAAVGLILSFSMSAMAENSDWDKAPTITHAYEYSKEKLGLEWDGRADLYQVNLDGKKAATVNVKTAVINIKPGQHNITIIPIRLESKDVNTSLELKVKAVKVNEVGANIDLAALGVDPKDTIQGNQSSPLKVNYKVGQLIGAAPEVNGAYTDFDDRVILTFTDKYDADIYFISIKSGKDIIETEFDTAARDAAALIQKQNSTVSVTLDPKYLRSHEWMVPDLDQEYGFAVRLGKHPNNLVDNKEEKNSIVESKDSKYLTYTPYAAWKNAPEIVYASQTADGTVTLKWEHDDNHLGCEYKVISLDKILVVKKGEQEIGRTKNHEFVVKDLMNGKHTFAVIPVYGKSEGFSSDQQELAVENDWVAAPSLECSVKSAKQVELTWESPKGVDNYHITVSVGSGNLLRFVNLDYKKYQEFDVEAKAGTMHYTYDIGQITSTDEGVKLKFAIYGSRRTEKGEEQKSAVSTQTITVK